MKKKWYLIIGFSIIYIVSFTVPFVMICGLKTSESIGIASSISASIATFLTLIIVILFFDKYGLHKTVFDKTQGQMIKLIDELSELSLFGKHNETRYPNFTFSRNNLNEFKIDPKLADKKILFTDDYCSFLLEKIGKIQSSVWTPKDIKIKLDNIIPFRLSEIKDYDKEEFIILSKGSKQDFIGLFNGDIMTFRNYITCCEEILDEINKWLKKYGGDPNDFDF